MKKITFLAAMAIAVATMTSCDGGAPKASLKSDVDSVSYAIGMAQTQGLKDYLVMERQGQLRPHLEVRTVNGLDGRGNQSADAILDVNRHDVVAQSRTNTPLQTVDHMLIVVLAHANAFVADGLPTAKIPSAVNARVEEYAIAEQTAGGQTEPLVDFSRKMPHAQLIERPQLFGMNDFGMKSRVFEPVPGAAQLQVAAQTVPLAEVVLVAEAHKEVDRLSALHDSISRVIHIDAITKGYGKSQR